MDDERYGEQSLVRLRGRSFLMTRRPGEFGGVYRPLPEAEVHDLRDSPEFARDLARLG